MKCTTKLNAANGLGEGRNKLLAGTTPFIDCIENRIFRAADRGETGL
jgi:hypothetical protein